MLFVGQLWYRLCLKYTRLIEQSFGNLIHRFPMIVAREEVPVSIHRDLPTHGLRKSVPSSEQAQLRSSRNEYWPNDPETKEFIEEWMGYCMTDDVRLHKGAMLIGKGRNGKGTIAHVIRRLVGDASFVSLNFDTWVKTENSTAPIIGRKVGCFGDVRLKRGKEYGAQFYDPGGLNQAPSQRNCSKNTPIPNSACGI
jgi:hypothetical protein